MIPGSRASRTALAMIAMLAPAATLAAPYDPAACALVAGTLDIHWRAVGGPVAPCTSIETTDGTFAAAASGRIVMDGVNVSNFDCTYPSHYDLVVSADGRTLAGNTQSLYPGEPVVFWTLTRAPDEACFSGHWIDAGYDYVGHIWARPFLRPAPVPASGPQGLAALAGVLGLLATFALRRRRKSPGARAVD